MNKMQLFRGTCAIPIYKTILAQVSNNKKIGGEGNKRMHCTKPLPIPAVFCTCHMQPLLYAYLVHIPMRERERETFLSKNMDKVQAVF